VLLTTTLERNSDRITGEHFRNCSFLDVTDYDLVRILPLWNNSIDFTPKELLKIFERAFDKGFCFKLTLETASSNIVFQLFKPNSPINENYFQNTYNFSDPNNLVLIESDVRLEPNARGRNWGHKFDALFVELNVALGVRKYSFDATKENGAYVWPLKGYFMKLETDEDLLKAKTLSLRVLARLGVLENLIPEGVYQEAVKLSQFKDKKDICRLASIDFDLSQCLTIGDFDSRDGHLYDALRKSFYSLSEPKDFVGRWGRFRQAKDSIEGTLLFCRDREKKFTLGKFSLAGECAECVCDYDDDYQTHKIFGNGDIFQYTKYKSSQPTHVVKLPHVLSL
jgi:hypothetical protein